MILPQGKAALLGRGHAGTGPHPSGEVRAQRLRHPQGHDRARGRKLVEVLRNQPGQDGVETILDLIGTEPCQGVDDHPRHPVRGRQLPARADMPGVSPVPGLRVTGTT